MKKKVYTRPVSVMLSEDMFNQIKAVTDKGDIGISDYIREAIEDKMTKNDKDGRNES